MVLLFMYMTAKVENVIERLEQDNTQLSTWYPEITWN